MKTVLIRVELTPDEWKAIRKLGIDRGVRVSTLVGDALRKHLLPKAAA